MRLALTLCTVLALTACVAPGPNEAPQAIRTFRGNLVVPDPAIPGQFEVFVRAGDSGSDLWCAASEFAERELRVPVNRRIYLVTPRGLSQTRPGLRSAIFTVSPEVALLDAARDLPDSLSMDVTRPGRNFLPLHGRIACRPILDLPFE
ncbi:hypothetical protein NHN26_17205 [Rhodovulum tesquicola]|uniref:hypothetical protein n=1 Tax=Rhodovulum tesquicola TaxID=540254 RepID=UPI0020975D83|nr:hypothetical protein [Rhodovulum tesquicola]MCO8146927.1 hypothetical protein [Rhodovulum tesquicola]